MELGLILKAVLALLFVLGLLFLTVWFFKFCELKGGKNRFFQKLQKQSRLEIIEVRKIDLRNSLVLVKRDQVEHLLLLSNNQSLIIESSITTSNLKDQA